MAPILRRPDKLDHKDTILYEISMLRYTTERLSTGTLVERAAWVYLESFLVHYRNLISFLGASNPSKTDLHVTNIWPHLKLPPAKSVSHLHTEGKKLFARYEPSDEQGGGRISQYLSHCTTKRIDFKEWDIGTMYNEIEPLLTKVENLLGVSPNLALKVLPSLGQISSSSASTMVGTMTTGAAVSFADSMIDLHAPVGKPPFDEDE